MTVKGIAMRTFVSQQDNMDVMNLTYRVLFEFWHTLRVILDPHFLTTGQPDMATRQMFLSTVATATN